MWEETVESSLKSKTETFTLVPPSWKKKADPFFILMIGVIGGMIVILAVKFRIFHLWVELWQNHPFLRRASYPLMGLAFILLLGLLFRTVLWFRYKPMSVEPGEEIDWPFISVIMPAFNEEELVESSIDSIFSCHYPPEKLEVICVNDGSADSTLLKMRKAKQKYKERLEIIHEKRNSGKRKALYSGFKKSRGEVVITVDTDSKIDPNALKNLVIPLIKDEHTGAVAGRVEAWNEKENFLTRMLAIRYSISFNFGRAYQSVYGAVFCCPGSLTAYRKNVLSRFIHEWVEQEFMNAPCTYGEDRALTTQMLKRGYMTRFQSNAVVYTRVPSRFKEMNRMYLRWTRSYLRESVLFAKFMFSRYRKKHRILPIFDFFFLNFLHPFHLYSIGLVVYSFFLHPLFILPHVAFFVVLSFLISLYYIRTKRSLAFLYGIPYALITAFCLWWIVPFSALTMRNQSWLTR
ncbi:glycosyltransferase family 2 protein [bacterium]|nr:glycosyltransferase family 2 protein [bacterium]